LNRSTRRPYPRSVSTERWRLTSIIFHTDAPCSAALVRKPERRLWPAKLDGSGPGGVVLDDLGGAEGREGGR
jgi:hypothetical protein